MSANRFDVVVLGAGAAGLFCAAIAGQRGRRVALLDHADRPGKKILISGGGRCNFTNTACAPANFLSANAHFCKSALARYGPADFVALVNRHRVPWHEKKQGQLFCDRSAQDIVGLLVSECEAGQVETRFRCEIRAVQRTTGFVVETSGGVFEAPALVVATGGLSIPKIRATPFGYRLAQQFGLPLQPPRPALVPLTLNERDRAAWCGLAGVAAEVVASCGNGRFRERMLITHRGLSGPAILQASSYWRGGEAVELDLLPEGDLDGKRPVSRAMLAERLPRRFAERWLELEGQGAEETTELSRRLRAWRVKPGGTEGYEKAEVTAGGVDTAALSSKTMQARDVPGLYFVGEVVDVTGHLGGHNFQWAWSSGFAAGMAV